MLPMQAGCSSEAEELAAEVAAKQDELAQAQAQQAACQEAADGLARDVTETERRLQVHRAGTGAGSSGIPSMAGASFHASMGAAAPQYQTELSLSWNLFAGTCCTAS